MSLRHGDPHFTKVSDLLPLETIEIRLNRGTRVLEILRRQVKCVFELDDATVVQAWGATQ